MALAGESAVLVNLSYGDLDGGMVLGLDDAVGGALMDQQVAFPQIFGGEDLRWKWL